MPTSGGATVPGKKNKPKKNSLPPAVSNSIEQQGGSDAGILREVATSPDYGAPATSAPKGNAGNKPKAKKGKRKDAAQGAQGTARGASPEGHVIPRPQDSSPSEALSAAVSAVQGGDAARMVGLLVVLFLISVAALATAALRHRRRAL